MKIAFITSDNRDHCRNYEMSSPYFGPAPEAVISGFSRTAGIEVHIVSCTQVQMKSPSLLSPNIHFHSLHVPKIGWLRTGYLGCTLAVRRVLHAIQPDIVHAQGTERDCAISAAFTSFPKVLTIHGNIRSIASITRAPLFSFWWFQAKLESLVLPMFEGVLCNSTYTKSLVSPFAKKTWLVPNALRLSFFSPPSTTRSHTIPLRFLVIGTITAHKQPLTILKMFKSMHKQGLPFRVTFVGSSGDDPYGQAFREAAVKAKLDGWLDYMEKASVSDLIKLMDSSHALLHFPQEEAFGLVVAEALARGLKLFAAKVGGIVDIAKGVQDAELFDVDDLPGLEYSLKAWIHNPVPPSPFSRVLMESRYHPKVIAARHLEIYQSVLNASFRINE